MISISDAKVAQVAPVAHPNQHQVMIREAIHFRLQEVRNQGTRITSVALQSQILFDPSGLHIGHLLVVLAHLVLL